MEDFLDKLAARDPKDDLIDLDLWRQWQDNGQRPDDLRPLLQRFRPMIRKRANMYAGATRDVGIPPAAIHAEFDKWFLKAIDTFDPNKGRLGTWVGDNLKKGQRWVMNRRNVARIQEKRAYKVGEYQRAMAVLDDQLGRPPSSFEVAEYLQWPEKRVQMIEREARRSLMSGTWEQYESGQDPIELQPSEDLEKLQLLRYQLNPRELQVFDHLLGWGGKPKMKANDIARMLNVSPSTVTRIKKSIADKLKTYS